MAVTSRSYQGEADYERMRQLLRTIYPLRGPLGYCSIGDLDWWRGTDNDPNAVTGTHLWFEGDQLVAFAWPSGEQVDCMCHPQHIGLEAEMLDWAEERRNAAPESTEPLTLKAWAFTRDTARIALLQSRGYTRNDTSILFRLRHIFEEIPEVTLPAGYSIRHVRGEEDLEARVAVHRDAFAPSRMTVEKHRRVMSLPTYQPELDLVVEAPDGSFAAFCIVWFDEANRLGVFEPVGCHSAHRRRGLTRALMYEGLRRLQARGTTTANVCSAGTSVPANALYDSAGFVEIDRSYNWEKQLSK